MFRLLLSHLQALYDTDPKQSRLVYRGILNAYIYLVYGVEVCMTIISVVDSISCIYRR